MYSTVIYRCYGQQNNTVQVYLKDCHNYFGNVIACTWTIFNPLLNFLGKKTYGIGTVVKETEGGYHLFSNNNKINKRGNFILT